MVFHEFLLKELKQRKGQVPSVGKKAGVGNTTIQNWITGGHMPPIDKAEKVLNALGYEIKIIKKEDK